MCSQVHLSEPYFCYNAAVPKMFKSPCLLFSQCTFWFLVLYLKKKKTATTEMKMQSYRSTKREPFHFAELYLNANVWYPLLKFILPRLASLRSSMAAHSDPEWTSCCLHIPCQKVNCPTRANNRTFGAAWCERRCWLTPTVARYSATHAQVL